MKKNKSGLKQYFNKISTLLYGHRKTMVWCLVFMGLSALFDVASSIFSAYYGINKALESRQMSKIVIAAVIIGILSLLSVIFFHITYRKSIKLVKTTADEIRAKIFKKAIYLDANFFTTHSTGAMINTIMYDVSIFTDGMANSLQSIMHTVTKMVLAFIVLTIINVKLSAILWVSTPVLALIVILIYRRISKLYDKRRTITKNRLSYINESIMGVKTVKTLNLENFVDKKFAKFNRENTSIQVRLGLLSDLLWRIFDVFMYVSIAILFITSYKLAVSYGELFLYYQLFKYTLRGVTKLAMDFDRFSEVNVSAGKIYNLLTYVPLVKDKEITIENPENFYGNITFKDVTFTYPDGETVLENFNLSIPSGKKFAIVGKTGSGKSTIANLIYRYYEPNSGQILFDGQDYTDLKISYIHDEIGFILQEPMLFDDTIYENLRYAKPDATNEEIENVAKLVGADIFIKKLENGFDTKIGENGILLSTGQKQLLAFARVILKNPSVIILDEATANIDSQTENLIQQNINTLFADKTCIFIAHRLSTITNSDQIILLENGKILESGNHAELLKLDGKYAALYNNQFIKEKINKQIF